MFTAAIETKNKTVGTIAMAASGALSQQLALQLATCNLQLALNVEQD